MDGVAGLLIIFYHRARPSLVWVKKSKDLKDLYNVV